MFDSLIEIVARVWKADSDIRDRSLLGESALDRKTGRSVAWLCGGSILFLLLSALAFWWWSKR